MALLELGFAESMPLGPGNEPINGHGVYPCPCVWVTYPHTGTESIYASWIRISNLRTGTVCIQAIGPGYRILKRAQSHSMPSGPGIEFTNEHGIHSCPRVRVSSPQTGTESIQALGFGYHTHKRVWNPSKPSGPGIGPCNGHELPQCPWVRVLDPHTSTECLHALGSGYRILERARSTVHALGSGYQILRRARSTSLPLDPGIGPSHEHGACSICCNCENNLFRIAVSESVFPFHLTT